jgi:hypothetical protein
MSEPWTYDHIHEESPHPNRTGRTIVAIALVYVFALMNVVDCVQSAKGVAQRVKRRVTGYNKNRRSSK